MSSMKRFFILVFFVTVLFACNKQKEETFCTEATVLFMGDPAADGLGWVLFADSTRGLYYVPSNLPASFKKNGLVVNVCMYKTEEKVSCFCAAPPNKYFITSIKPL